MEKYISLAEEIAKKISDMVSSGKYKAGSKLPNEEQLAKTLGVSRTSIREAVKILTAINILEIKRGVGTFVSESTHHSYDPFNMVHSSNRKRDTEEALELRLILEPAIIEEIFFNATEKDLNEIYELEAICRQKIIAGESYADFDLNFHEALAKASHNVVYEKLVPLLHSSIVMLQHSAKDLNKTREYADNALVYHEKIVQCIKNKDIIGAKLASETHLYNALCFLNDHEGMGVPFE